MSYAKRSGSLAHLIIARAQEAGAKGTGDYSLRKVSDQAGDEAAAFPQAATESGDFESFFRFFPGYLVKDALRGKDVLDFGCGYGGRTVEYKLSGGAKRVCGVEPFENVIELSRRYAESRGADVEFRVCGHRDIPYPDASFDIVLSYDVLEHVEDPRAAMAEIFRVLRPGGLSINVFPVYFGANAHHLDYIVNLPGLHWLFPARTLVKAVNRLIAERPGSGLSFQPEPKRSFDGAREVLPQLNGLSGWHLGTLFGRFETVSLERHPAYYWKPRLGQVTGAIARSSRLPVIVRDAMTHSVASVLRKPGPVETAPLTRVDDLPIAPIPAEQWTLFKPARRHRDGIVIRGRLQFPRGYAAASPRYELPQGARIVATGIVKRGGIAVGLLDSQDRWAASAPIPRGRFRRWIEAPSDGAYRIVVTNNVLTRWPINHVRIDAIGLVGLDPAAHLIEHLEPQPSHTRSLYAWAQWRFSRYAWARRAFAGFRQLCVRVPGGRRLLSAIGSPERGNPPVG